MRHFWQWFSGYVCIYLNGRQLNRFLNLCSRNGIHLWHIYFDLEHKVRASLLLKDFYQLKPFLRKTKTKMRILHRRGFPFWCNKHPRLKWFFVACICAFVVLCYTFTFIWSIHIHGNTTISSNEILEFLESQEICTWRKKNEIDCGQVEYLIRSEFPNIAWVSVSLNDTKLTIELKESLYDEYELSEDESQRYDLIANKEAIIYSIVTRTGKGVVVAGEHVKKGDTLVIGECAIYDDVGEVSQVLHKKADALIWADVCYDFSCTLSEMEIISLKIANTYNDSMLRFLAEQKLQHFIEKLEQNGVIILNKNVMIEKKEKSIVFTGKIYAREVLGTNILVEEVIENEFE